MAADTGTNVGYASLQVIPTVSGIAGNISGQIIGPLSAAGQAAGRQAGQGIVSGVESAAAKVRSASEKVAKSREAEIQATAKVRIAEAKLQELRDRGVTTGSRLLQAEENLRRAQANGTRTTDEARRAAEDLERAQREAADATDDLGDELDDTGRRSILTGENMAKFGAAAVAGIGAAGAALYKVGGIFDDVSDTIRVGTGATGQSLADMEQIAKNVGATVPASFEAIGTTIADLNTRMGLSGPVLEQVTAQIQELGNMGQEIDINSLSGAMNAFGVEAKDTAGVLDELFRVSQATGVPINDLTATAIKGGPALRQFGFDLSESAGLMGVLDKSGLDAAKMMGGLTKSLGAFAKEGKDPQQALFGVVTEIEKFTQAGNNAAALDLANSLFGVKGGAQFVEAIAKGTLSVDDFVNATGAGGDTIRGAAEDTRDFAEQWELFKNRGLIALEPVATRVFGLLATGMEWFNTDGIPALMGFADWMDRNKVAIGIVAGVLGTLLLPALITAAVGWAGAGIAATKAAAMSVAGSYATIAGWVATAASATINAAVIATIWTAVHVKLAAGWVATRVVAVASFVATAIGAGVQAGITTAIWLASATKSAAGWAVLKVQAAASFAATAVAAGIHAARTALVWTLAMGKTAVQVGIATAAFVAQRVAMVAGAAVTGALTVAQWALNAAMSANPIGLVIAIVVALVAAIVLAYKNSETFRNIVQAAWDGIKIAVGFVWNNVLKPALDGFLAALGWVGDKAMWLWQTVMIPAWDAIKNAISVVWNFIRPILDNIGKGIEALGTIAAKVGDAMRNAFDGVVDVLKMPIHAVGKLLSKIPTSVLGIDIPGADTIRSWGETMQSLKGGGTIAGRTGAGVFTGPGTGTSDSIWGVDERGIPIVRVSKGEGVVRQDIMARGGDKVVAALNSGRIPALRTGGTIGEPYGLPSGTAISYGGSGFPPWVTELGNKFGVKPSTYAGHQESDRGEAGYAPNPQRLNRGIDWSGPVDALEKFARYLLGIAPDTPALEQIIWMNPNSGAKVGWAGRTPDTSGSYFASDYSGHQDHVHTRQSAALTGGAPPKPDTSTAVPGYVPPTYGPEGTDPGALTSTAPGTTGATTAPEPNKTRLKSFKELGSEFGGIFAEGIGETFGLPDWIMDPQGYIDSNTDTGSNVRTSVTNGQNTPTTGPQVSPGTAPGTTGGFAPDTPETLRAGQQAGTNPNGADPSRLKGMANYVYWIAKAAKDMNLGQRGAMIGTGTGLVESGDPMKMYANNKVPASLKFPHDAVGSDGTSTGLFQQQDNGAWGTIADRMDPYRSAKMFYNGLVKLGDWQSMDPGAAAQAVQRSAFPDKYGKVMARAAQLVKETKLFDTGGIWEPGTFGFNGLKEPELVVKRHQWGVMDRNAAVVEGLARRGDLGGRSDKIADVVNVQGYTIEEVAAEWRRHQWSRNAGYGTSRNR